MHRSFTTYYVEYVSGSGSAAGLGCRNSGAGTVAEFQTGKLPRKCGANTHKLHTPFFHNDHGQSQCSLLEIFLTFFLQYGESAPSVDPYSDAYTAPPTEPPISTAPSDRDGFTARGRSRSRSPGGPPASNGGYRSPPPRRRSPQQPRRPAHAPVVCPHF